MQIPQLQEFALAGGTALSLMYGHRTSIDIDLFSISEFDNDEVSRGLLKVFGAGYDLRTSSRFGIFCIIDGVKVDIVRFPHPMLRPLVTIDGIRMFSPEDNIALKVQAILGRGKKKVFWDIAELLDHFSVTDFISLHKEKYSTQHLLISVPKAITYYDDAEESEDPVSLKGQNWQSVKAKIQKKVREFLV